MNAEQPVQPQEQGQTVKTTKDPSRASDVELYPS
jgi:hypothetical protein